MDNDDEILAKSEARRMLEQLQDGECDWQIMVDEEIEKDRERLLGFTRVFLTTLFEKHPKN